MRSVQEIPHFENIPILVRAALNVPIQDGAVSNAYRLRRALPTLQFLSKRHARVVVISHLGEKGTETLAPVVRELQKLLPRVSFCNDTIGAAAREAIRSMHPGDILVLENLRRNAGEKENDPAFARALAELADVFVEDSFDTCHRAHASIIGVPRLLPSYAGLLLEDEVRELSEALAPKHPALAAIGGAKFSTKEPVLAALLRQYDHVFVGGALASDFLKAAGFPVGQSLVSGANLKQIHALGTNIKLRIPIDVRVTPAETVNTPEARSASRVANVRDVRPNECIVDHGPETDEMLRELLMGAKTILWNGPFGKYEDGCVDGTDAFARAVALSKAHSVIGGGDTIAAIEKLRLFSKFSFISTGGGSMLDFLSSGTLPGIEALNAYRSA